MQAGIAIPSLPYRSRWQTGPLEVAWDCDPVIHRGFHDLANHLNMLLLSAKQSTPLFLPVYAGNQGNVLILGEKEDQEMVTDLPLLYWLGGGGITKSGAVLCRTVKRDWIPGCVGHLVVDGLAMQMQKGGGSSECSNNKRETDTVVPRKCISNGLDYIQLGWSILGKCLTQVYTIP